MQIGVARTWFVVSMGEFAALASWLSWQVASGLLERLSPSITGLAQARGFRGATPTVWHMRSRVTFDRFYVDNWSLALDIRIIIDTLRMIIRGNQNAV